ncbi:unnamed protein product, partial [Rotaria sp. Silwood1]
QIHSTDYIYRANRIEIELSSSYYNHSNELIDENYQDSSENINESICNLTKIVEDIGYNPKLPYIHSSFNNTNNVFSNTSLQLDETHESAFNTWHPVKYQCSTSMIQYKPIIDMNKETIEESNDSQSNIIIPSPVSINFIPKQIDEKFLKTQIEQIYGIDDIDTTNSILSQSSSMNEINSFSDQTLKTIDNLKCKQQITIREYYPTREISSTMAHRSLSSYSSQQTINDN